MNLGYVKDFLKSKGDSISTADIAQLISEIEAYQGTENTLMDISRVMRVISEYNTSFLVEVKEYDLLPKDKIEALPLRMEKARDILCTLSALQTYLILSMSNIKESTYDTKNIRGYLSDLSEKKEHFRSEKMTWVTILKSLTQEAEFVIDLRKMDIEDKLGYIKY